LATLADRIQDLIGFDFNSNTTNAEKETIESAYAEVIDLMPEEILLKHAEAPIDLTSGSPTLEVEGKKVIRVIRYDADSVTRICEKSEIDDFKEATAANNASSIYRPTKFTPMYTFDPESGTTLLKVFPDITGGSGDAAETAKVYYVSYLDGQYAFETSLPGLPKEVENAVAIKAATYLLSSYISDAIQEDEDAEMLQMLQAQMQVLQGMYQAEIGRFVKEKASD
jgi:hypothetical protein